MKGKGHIKGKRKVLQWESDRISFGLRVAFALDYDFSNKCVTNYILVILIRWESFRNKIHLFKFIISTQCRILQFCQFQVYLKHSSYDSK